MVPGQATEAQEWSPRSSLQREGALPGADTQEGKRPQPPPTTGLQMGEGAPAPEGLHSSAFTSELKGDPFSKDWSASSLGRAAARTAAGLSPGWKTLCQLHMSIVLGWREILLG